MTITTWNIQSRLAAEEAAYANQILNDPLVREEMAVHDSIMHMRAILNDMRGSVWHERLQKIYGEMQLRVSELIYLKTIKRKNRETEETIETGIL